MSVLTETITLANGHTVRKIGFGTWLLNEGDQCYDEASVGRAIRDSGIPREQIYVTSKLPAEAKRYARAVADFETTMAEIGLDYLDLYLVHAPWPWDERAGLLPACTTRPAVNQIRWFIGLDPSMPKATSTDHIRQNAELGFQISAEDMGVLDAMRDTDKHSDAMEFRWA
jgi:diketogulonate reductase-like aldo/keto reductase